LVTISARLTGSVLGTYRSHAYHCFCQRLCDAQFADTGTTVLITRFKLSHPCRYCRCLCRYCLRHTRQIIIGGYIYTDPRPVQHRALNPPQTTSPRTS
jgi:hypothetical protein